MTNDDFMAKVYEDQRRINKQMEEIALMRASMEIFNDTFQAIMAVQNAQTLCLMYAGLNPNFCKPK